ncbi:MAG: exodeoxyribonuclease VII small subunit [Bacteroidales bacterium]|jgi:exodeoxyribonuclease VII small subunit|nr:exodeoxyribonuclease VII small subunit [Bacteroidales bacterium]
MKKTYTEAYEELQELVELLENAEISVDELSEKIKLATELIKICENKLTSTEAEVSKIIQGLTEE